MQIYLVGGAVRDELLGLPVQEKDWVVVGATPDAMLKQGFQPVGKDFPVFLHPKTKEEYALARTERKVAKGYHGFEWHADPSVTLEEDLMRRDLTINAIAQNEEGQLIDPMGGCSDIEQKCFRHVSPAFREDPVRILRLARFQARFDDFHVHPETLSLMHDMVSAGEVDALVPERVWKECVRALGTPSPWLFFDLLERARALPALFPVGKYWPQCQQALKRACGLSSSTLVRWAAWSGCLTPEDTTALSKRMRLPKAYSKLSLQVATHRQTYLCLKEKPIASNLLTLLKKLSALRSTDQLVSFQAAVQSQIGENLRGWNQRVLEIAQSLSKIDTQPLQNRQLTGLDFAKALQNQQQSLIEHLLMSK